MSKGIEISFLSNVRDLLKGASSVDDALEKVSDALDEVTRDGDKAGDKLERSFRDVSQEARDATRDIDKTGNALKEAGRKGQSIDADVRVGTQGAGEAVREWGDEAKQNISETFSSFRGESGDLLQVVQDTFGGVISNLGPLGMVAGAAGAVGIGLMQGAMEDGQEEAEAFRERVSQLADAFIAAGGVGETSLETLVDQLKELATETEEGADNLADIRKDSEGSVAGFRKIADAYAGNTRELDKLVESEWEHYRALKAASEESGISWRPADQAAASAKRDAQKRIAEGLDEAKKAADDAEAAESAWLASNGPAYEARVQKIDAIQSELDDAIGTWGDYADAEKGSTDPAGYIKAFEDRITATNNFATNVQELARTTGLSFEEAQMVLDQGVDFAPMLQSILDSGLADEFAAQVKAAVGGGQEIVDGKPLTATIEADADVTNARRRLSSTSSETRTAKITAKADTKTAAAAIDKVADEDRRAKVKAIADTAAAKKTLDELVKKREAIIVAKVVDREGRKIL